ncbi:MAG TPA: hypothetical protein VHQ20_01225 [Patescibacteria group bacterium]|jgi:hypothetical protein|nr:hypothetical protein [Patescibacteria group bacterium]
MNESELTQRPEYLDKSQRETTQVAGVTYDVIELENYLQAMEPPAEIVDMNTQTLRLVESVEEGNKYWDVSSADGIDINIGPSDFLSKWKEQKSENPDLEVDEFLENLKTTNPEWLQHILSIQHAKDNLDKPIWLYSNESVHPHPFDGMHRLTRAYLEGLPTIKVIFWEQLPDEAKV